MANLPLGGGKAVIIGNPRTDITEAKLLAYANAVNALGGRYITAMDVGIGPKEMPIIARGTRHAAGFDQPGTKSGCGFKLFRPRCLVHHLLCLGPHAADSPAAHDPKKPEHVFFDDSALRSP